MYFEIAAKQVIGLSIHSSLLQPSMVMLPQGRKTGMKPLFLLDQAFMRYLKA